MIELPKLYTIRISEEEANVLKHLLNESADAIDRAHLENILHRFNRALANAIEREQSR